MAYIHGVDNSVRYFFLTQDKAWKFAQDMVACGRQVVSYGKIERRLSPYYVDIK